MTFRKNSDFLRILVTNFWVDSLFSITKMLRLVRVISIFDEYEMMQYLNNLNNVTLWEKQLIVLSS